MERDGMAAELIERAKTVVVMGACTAAALPFVLTPSPLPLTVWLTRRFAREEWLQRYHRLSAWGEICSRHILKLELSVEGREHRPRPSRGHMYVSNHQSYVDILVLMTALDTAAFLAKRMIRYLPLIGYTAFAGGTVYVERGDQRSRQRALDEVIRMCRESTAVVVFPEGTRSADGRLGDKIHPGALRRAYDEGLRIVPVGLDGTYRVVPKTNDRVVRGQRAAVTIGAALDPRDFEDAEAWTTAVWGRVGELVAASRRRLEPRG